MIEIKLEFAENSFSLNDQTFEKNIYKIDHKDDNLIIFDNSNKPVYIVNRDQLYKIVNNEKIYFPTIGLLLSEFTSNYRIDGGAGNKNIVLTQAEYDALTPPDPNTTYDIIEA